MIEMLLRLHDEIDTACMLINPDDNQARYDYMKYLVEQELARLGFEELRTSGLKLSVRNRV